MLTHAWTCTDALPISSLSDFDLKSLQASLSLQTAENAKLQGVVQTLEKVLENRDPKLQEVLIGILAFMQKIEKHMEAHDKKAVS